MRFLGPDADTTDELATFDQVGDKLDCFTFSHQGVLTTGNGDSRKYMQYPGDIVAVRLSVSTAPQGFGTRVIVDVNKNGTTVFTNQSNRPEIDWTDFTGDTTTIQAGSFAAGDYMRVDIDQVGSTFAGADLVVDIYYRRS